MIGKRTRFLLILTFIILGVLLHVKQGISSAWYLYVAAAILLITHFIFGNVWSAFSMLKKGNMAQAETMIDEIKRPDLLLKGHRAYYHFIKGIISLQDKEFENGEQHLKSALDLGLRTDNDRALVHLNLAHICLAQKRPKDARQYVDAAKDIPYNDLMLKDKIKEMDQALNTRMN